MRREYYCLLILGLVVFFLAGPVSETFANNKEEHAATERKSVPETVQKTCPVMEGNKIDSKIFTEYKGKKVYFCCPSCKAAFLKYPEKYLDRLPQFSSSAHAAEEHVHMSSTGLNEGISWENLFLILVKPFGITTLTLLIATACAGFFMRKKPKVLFKWHKRMAYTTVIVALSHAVLVFITH